MDNPIIFHEINDNERYSLRNKEGKFYVDDSEDEFPKFFIESGVARKIYNFLVAQEKRKKEGKKRLYDVNEKCLNVEKENLKLKGLIDNIYNNHYLVKACEECYTDDQIEKIIKERLPDNFKVFSDDKFLIISEEVVDSVFDNLVSNDLNIIRILNIPKSSLLFKTSKQIKNKNYEIFYFDWKKILNKEEMMK